MKNINELFALPFSTEKIGNLYGTDLYSSPSLKAKYAEAIKSSDYFNYIPNVENLIEKDIIVPAFANKNMISFLGKKFPLFRSFNNDYNPITMGFYNPGENKIYILIDNNSNFVGVANNNELGKLLAHEMIHLFCATRPKLYLKYFNSELRSFYKKAFILSFQADVPDEELDKIISTICLKYELGENFSLKDPLMYMFKSIKRYTKLSEKDLMNNLSEYILSWYYSVTNDPMASSKDSMKFHNMFHRIYTDEFKVDIRNKECLQEALTTSEVIAGLTESETMMDKVSKVSKALEKIL